MVFDCLFGVYSVELWFGCFLCGIDVEYCCCCVVIGEC